MAELTWAGSDGFDSAGRRVVGVVWCFDLGSFSAVQGGGNSGPGFIAPRWYWEAFVASGGRFDNVLVNGEPGRWAKKAEAKVAAEAAYRTWVTEPSSDSASVAGEDGAHGVHPEAIDDRGPPVTGVLGNIRSLVGAWRIVYRSDRRRVR
jgi:hypothetical protein